MKLDQEMMKFFRDFMLNTDDCNLREKYSGRSMYGAECFGFTTSDSVLKTFGWLVNELCQDDENSWIIVKLLDCVKTDNMGLDTIIYFPGIEWDSVTEGMEDEEEMEEDIP